MDEENDNSSFNTYDTTLKDISGVKDISIFFNIFRAMPFSGEVPEHFIVQYLSEIRTEKTRTKVAWAVNKTLLQFYNTNHRLLVRSIFQKGTTNNDLNFVFMWHFALSNRLFKDITTKVFVPVYYSGRAVISKDDIIPFIKEIKKSDGTPLWADNTIYRIATKYLSIMSKLGFLSAGRVKNLKNVRPSSEALVLYLYFAKLIYPDANNILTNELLPISFVPAEDFHDRLKKLSLKGFFNMNFNGVALNIELTHSYRGICDVLYN